MKRLEILLLVLAVLCVIAIVVNTLALGKLMSDTDKPSASAHSAYCQQYGHLYQGVPDNLNYCEGK